MAHSVYIALGSNMGHREGYINQALELLRASCHIKAVSSLYESEPLGYSKQADFLNAAAQLETKLEPTELLEELLACELKLHRIRQIKNGPRTIDLDILFFDNQVLKKTDLIIPHPRMHQRSFVLTPLKEIAPDFLHPVLKKSISELEDELVTATPVRLYKPQK